MIIILEEGRAWSAFLKEHEHRYHHTPAFKAFIKEGLGIDLVYLAYQEGNDVKTVLPFGVFKSWFFGNRIISVGTTEYGGFAGDPKYAAHLLNRVKEKGKTLDYVEIRQGVEAFDAFLPKYSDHVEQTRFILPLTTVDENWKVLQKEKRKAVRKAQKNLTVRELTEEDIPQLYKLYLHNMRSFGTPPYPKSFFTSFFKHSMGKCFGAFYEHKLAAMLLGFCYKDRIHVILASSYPQYLNLRSNDLVHWAFIEWGCNNKYQVFDFGIAREESGHFTYKKKWGAHAQPLNKYFIYLKAKESKEPSPDQYQFIRKLYKHAPLSLTAVIGRLVRVGMGI